MASQMFLNDPPRVDPDRVIRFASSCALSVVPVWFGFQRMSDPGMTVWKRMAMETFILGPVYLSSVLFWTKLIESPNTPLHAFDNSRQNFLALYWDAIRVVPVYNAFTHFVVAPHMRGYALSGFQFVWNMYVSWFVQDSLVR